MTGANHSKLARSKALDAGTLTETAAALPASVESVSKGNLYFIVTRSTLVEWWLRVGLGEAAQDYTDPTGPVDVKWFVRNEWVKRRQFE